MTARHMPVFAFHLLSGATAVALIAGAAFLSARRADRLLRADLLLQARLVAQAVDGDALRTLSGTEADLASPGYWQLKHQLMSIVQANPKCKWFYLMGRTADGMVFFFVDSEAPDVADASPPGQLYEEASPACHRLFADPAAIVEGPVSDRWGVWVSALVPITDPATGSVAAVLGMDIEARDWYWIVAWRAALPTTLAAIAILLGLLVVLLQQSRRQLRKRQAELQESETRFVQLAEQGRTFVWEVDPQGLYTHVSPACEPLLGYHPDELVGKKHFYDLHPEEDREPFRQAAFQVFDKHAPFSNLENAVQTRAGETRWFLTNGIPLLNDDGTLRGYRGSDSDITERKLSEAKVNALLAESNQSRQALLGILEDQMRAEADRRRLTMAIEQSAESIVVTDVQARIQYVNPAFTAVTGYSREEAIGQNPRILQSGRQNEAFYQAMWQALASGKAWQGRMVNKRKDGTLYTEDALISPVCDAAGNVTNFVAVKRDITDHLRLAQQLQQAQKMDSIGRLAGGVAHDFNNMLGVILGHAEVALDGLASDQPLHANLLEIRKAAERSADLTRQLLAFARKQAVTPKVLDLNETVEGMLNMLRRLIGENIALAWQPKASWSVRIDPSQIDQVLANLCVNARDAIEGAGTVSIETSNAILDSAFCAAHAGALPGEYVRLALHDSGCGMDAETLAHIFEPFFTTKGQGEGTGLGLATVYGIVKQNNGFIDVSSELGRGTTFEIYLPRQPDELALLPTPPSPAEESARGTESILLVEDEPAILEITGQMLESLGYAVRKASSPAEALRIAKECGDGLQLLVTDVVMPEMNGRDLAQQLRSEHPQLKCLFMSGYTADIIARNGMVEGSLHFIQKPFSKQTLAAKLREALNSGSA